MVISLLRENFVVCNYLPVTPENAMKIYSNRFHLKNSILAPANSRVGSINGGQFNQLRFNVYALDILLLFICTYVCVRQFMVSKVQFSIRSS